MAHPVSLVESPDAGPIGRPPPATAGRTPREADHVADRRAEADRAHLRSATRQLAAVFAPSPPGRLGPTPGRDPLFEACRLAGDALGVAVEPGVSFGADSVEAPLERIARASRGRTRRVALAGPWWQIAGDPLVGYRAVDGRPVALLPVAGGYALHDPVEGSVTPVTAAVAASLQPFGESFYRPSGERSLTAWRLLGLGLRGGRRELAVVLGLSAALGLLGLLTPLVTGVLVDLSLPGGYRSLLLQLGAWLVIGAVVSSLIQLARDVAVLRLAGRLQAVSEAAIVDRLLHLPVGFFGRYTAGDLAGRLLAVGALRQAATGPVLSTLLSALPAGLGLAMLFVYDARLATVATAFLLGLVATVAAGGYEQVRCQRALGEHTGRLAGLVVQLVAAVPKLRAAGAEVRGFAVWADRFAAQRRLAYRARAAANRLAVFVAAYPLAASAALFAVVAFAGESRPSVGTFLAFTAVFGQLVGVALRLAQAGTALAQAVPAYERVRPVLQTPPEAAAGRVEPGPLRGAIEVERVTFRYEAGGPPILDDVSIACGPGELVALVGASGSGKSTLLRLLLGFDAPQAGTIRYDGRDLATLDVRAVRRQTGAVLQDSRLLAGDLFTNIVGGSTLTLADAWAAAGVVGLDEEIRRLPMGLHTVVGASGGTLSGGQRQRLVIARAIAHRPRVLLLDEATSALDNRSQALVAGGLERLAVTRVVVAHRLSTVVRADRIYVLDRGRVVESGTYGELMARGGTFAALARRQLA